MSFWSLKQVNLCVRERGDGHNHSVACSSQFSPSSLKTTQKNEKELQVLEVAGSEKTNFSLNSFSTQNLKKKLELKYLEERQVLFSSPEK